MKIGEAADIVYDLAVENALEPELCETDRMREEAKKQQEALVVFHDFVVNNFSAED